MISASATPDVPWGYVCGYPTHRGDLYGGAHYRQSSAANLTPQGRAIAAASQRFGNGETLPFTPCKRGYIPVVASGNGDSAEPLRAMFACHLHDRFRRKRYLKEKSKFRPGEVDLSRFWQQSASTTAGKVPKRERTSASSKDLASASSIGSSHALGVLVRLPD